MSKFESWANDIVQHALQNYESDGWDYIVECFTLDELIELCAAHYSYDEAFASIAELASAYDEARSNTEF